MRWRAGVEDCSKAAKTVRTSTLGVVLLATILFTTGCEAVLTTTKLPPVRDDRILGEWKDLGRPGSQPQTGTILIRFLDGEYAVGSADDFTQGKAERVILARAGSELLMQSPGQNQCDEFPGQREQDCWTISRIELSGNKLNLYDFDAQQLGRESFSGAINVPHSLHRERKRDGSYDTTVLLSAEPPELLQFLTSYVTRRGIFHLTGRMQRLPAGAAQ